MQWLGENWIWVVVIAAFMGMHLFGHGGHGGHGGDGSSGGGSKPKEGEGSGSRPASGHRH